MKLGEAIDRLRSRPHVPLFTAEVWDAELDRKLRAAEPEALFSGREVRDPHAAAAALAGLHLWNDAFDASHSLCQGISTATGSYWHGLCHRREGHRGDGLESNLRNSRYWFRQVGSHPTFPLVYESALRVLDSAGAGFRWATEAAGQLRAADRWDPNALIDWFAQADAQVLSPQSQALLEEIQWREIDTLIDWCGREALGE